MMQNPYRTWVEISLDQIAANYHAIRRVVGEAVLVAPVVKADAYRHGATQVALRLEREGARWLAVSNAEEGVALRNAGVAARILVMGDFLEFEREALAANSLTPVIHSLARLRDYDRFVASMGRPLPIHLKIDTGMGRLGSRALLSELSSALAAAPHVQLEGLMTHFASAEDYGSEQTGEQMAEFESAVEALRTAGIQPPLLHLSNSAAIAYGRRVAWGTMVRPGLALYGYVSPAMGAAPARILNVQPALAWKARILEIREVPAGARVGYSARWRAERPSRLAVIGAGYADGVLPALANCGKAIAGGRLAPIAGAVSMDLITLDVTDCPPLSIGDAVTLLGREGAVKYDAEDIAQTAGTLAYAVLCGLGNRVKNVYV